MPRASQALPESCWRSVLLQEQLLEHSRSLVPMPAGAKLVSKYRGIRFLIRSGHTFKGVMKDRFSESELVGTRKARKQGRSEGQQME